MSAEMWRGAVAAADQARTSAHDPRLPDQEFWKMAQPALSAGQVALIVLLVVLAPLVARFWG